MNMGEAIQRGFRQALRIDGRSSRPEFWWFLVFAMVVPQLGSVADVIVSPGLPIVTLLAQLICGVALGSVGVRRLHDTNRSGWWLLLQLTGIGMIPLFLWLARPGDEGPNRFGPPLTEEI